MYFETTVARSIRKSSRPRSRASTCASHRLPRAGLAGEQHLQPLRARHRPLVAPLGEHEVAVAQVGRDGGEHLALALRQRRGRPSRRPARAARRARPGRVLDACLAPRSRSVGDGVALAPRSGREARDLGRLDDLPDREAELRRHVAHVSVLRVSCGPGCPAARRSSAAAPRRRRRCGRRARSQRRARRHR